MKTVTLNIPDAEYDFFLKVVEKFNFETVHSDFEFSDEIKNLLEQRDLTKKEDFLLWKQAKTEFTFK